MFTLLALLLAPSATRAEPAPAWAVSWQLLEPSDADWSPMPNYSVWTADGILACEYHSGGSSGFRYRWIGHDSTSRIAAGHIDWPVAAGQVPTSGTPEGFWVLSAPDNKDRLQFTLFDPSTLEVRANSEWLPPDATPATMVKCHGVYPIAPTLAAAVVEVSEDFEPTVYLVHLDLAAANFQPPIKLPVESIFEPQLGSGRIYIMHAGVLIAVNLLTGQASPTEFFTDGPVRLSPSPTGRWEAGEHRWFSLAPVMRLAIEYSSEVLTEAEEGRGEEPEVRLEAATVAGTGDPHLLGGDLLTSLVGQREYPTSPGLSSILHGDFQGLFAFGMPDIGTLVVQLQEKQVPGMVRLGLVTPESTEVAWLGSLAMPELMTLTEETYFEVALQAHADGWILSIDQAGNDAAGIWQRAYYWTRIPPNDALVAPEGSWLPSLWSV